MIKYLKDNTVFYQLCLRDIAFIKLEKHNNYKIAYKINLLRELFKMDIEHLIFDLGIDMAVPLQNYEYTPHKREFATNEILRAN